MGRLIGDKPLSAVERSRRWQRKYPDKVYTVNRRHRLKKQFGITLDVYNALLQSQNGKCKLCGQPQPNRDLAVDHDHVTGRIRGLLCTTCNVGLGALGDNEEGLLKALAYIRGT